MPALTVHLAGPLRPGPVDPDRPLRLLYLRLFDNRAGTEAFVDRWRRFGVVHYLRSADQVTADELKTWSRQVGDLSAFIDNDAELDDFLAATHPQPGPGPAARPWGEVIARTFKRKGH